MTTLKTSTNINEIIKNSKTRPHYSCSQLITAPDAHEDTPGSLEELLSDALNSVIVHFGSAIDNGADGAHSGEDLENIFKVGMDKRATVENLCVAFNRHRQMEEIHIVSDNEVLHLDWSCGGDSKYACRQLNHLKAFINSHIAASM